MEVISDIDYFTYFVKSWISFNAWYKNSYPNLKTDREAINEIKSSPQCLFRKRFLSLLNGNNEDSSYFKNNLAHFHIRHSKHSKRYTKTAVLMTFALAKGGKSPFEPPIFMNLFCLKTLNSKILSKIIFQICSFPAQTPP